MLIWIIAEEYGGRLAAAGRRLKEEDLGLSFAGETLCAIQRQAVQLLRIGLLLLQGNTKMLTENSHRLKTQGNQIQLRSM